MRPAAPPSLHNHPPPVFRARRIRLAGKAAAPQRDSDGLGCTPERRDSDRLRTRRDECDNPPPTPPPPPPHDFREYTRTAQGTNAITRQASRPRESPASLAGPCRARQGTNAITPPAPAPRQASCVPLPSRAPRGRRRRPSARTGAARPPHRAARPERAPRSFWTSRTRPAPGARIHTPHPARAGPGRTPAHRPPGPAKRLPTAVQALQWSNPCAAVRNTARPDTAVGKTRRSKRCGQTRGVKEVVKQRSHPEPSSVGRGRASKPRQARLSSG
jgi:hypothetical protein